MAARENQGYLIAVILLVLLSVILAIATYFGYTSMGEYLSQRDSLQANLVQERKASQAYQAQAGILKAYLGLANTSLSDVPAFQQLVASSGDQNVINETAAITDTYNQDMGRFINKPEGVDGTWKGLVEDFGNALNAQHAQIAILNNKVVSTEREKVTELEAKDKVLAETEKTLADTKQALEKEQTQHQETKQTFDQTVSDIDQLNKQINAEKQQAIDELATKTKEFESDSQAQRDKITALSNQLKSFLITETDVADGQIVSVSPILGNVTINLGYEDNLQHKQTFAVYDQQNTNFVIGDEKAKVEIIDIIGPHLSRARIIGEDIVNPILYKDFVVTTTWDPGYAVPVALAGLIDIDGDGNSDLERMISIINQSGGKVAAYHDEKGDVIGAIDEHTRFFVRGGEPTDAEMGTGYAILEEQRMKFEVTEISVRNFLKSIGFNSEARIQRLDREMGRNTQLRKPPARSSNGSAFDDK